MVSNTEYPEPDASSDAMHPYAHQYPIPQAGHPHNQHPVEASMRRNSNGSSDFIQGNNHGTAPGQLPTPQQLAQRSLDVNQGPDSNNPESSSRKRSKVSRACDECRRKKIRCDAESETPGIQCSSCRRAGSHCDFSRAPQKRGPSKGYIKELAERVNFLEYKTGAAPPEMQYSSIAPEHSVPFTPSGELSNRKRDLGSAAEGPSPYDNTYGPLPDFPPRSQRAHQDKPTGEDLSSAEALKLTFVAQSKPQNMNATVLYASWINAYYDLVHPSFPLLPKDIAKLQYNVENVPAGLCDAFFAALEAAINACTSTETQTSAKAATGHFDLIQTDPIYTATPLSKLVYLQALILMIVAADNSGPSRNQKRRWIGVAVDTATDMNLHRQDNQESDPDDHGSLGRRAWLILFILDRWHAFGNSDVLRVPELNCKLIDHDRKLLGNPAYHMYRISRSLGHIHEGFVQRRNESTSPVLRVGQPAVFLDEAIESFRESTSQEWGQMPQIHLVYLHVRMLADRYSEGWVSNWGTIIRGALQIVTLLRHKKGLYCAPWLHHIIAHTAVTLGEAADRQTGSDPPAALRDLRDGLETALFRSHNIVTAWDKAISAYITKKLDGGASNPLSEGLKELADAAVGNTEDGNAGGDTPFNRGPYRAPDLTVAISNGYLSSFE